MKTFGVLTGGEHPLFTDILKQHERIVLQRADKSLPPPAPCRCKRMRYPHPYEISCAIVATLASRA